MNTDAIKVRVVEKNGTETIFPSKRRCYKSLGLSWDRLHLFCVLGHGLGKHEGWKFEFVEKE